MERFRGILHEGEVEKRVQFEIERLFAVRKGGFSEYPSVVEELDLVERDDQITFEIGLDDDDLDKEEGLDVFRFDEDYEENEKLWGKIKKEILGEESDEETEDSDSGSEDDDEER